MGRDGQGLLPKRQQGYVAVALLFISIGFFIITAASGIDLAKPAWGMFFVSMYVIFGPAVGDLLLRLVTGIVVGAQKDNSAAKKLDDEESESRKGGQP